MHEPVLLHETVDGLDIRPGDVVVDGTLGRAGHALEALKAARIRGGEAFIIGIDRDLDALAESRVRLEAAEAKFQLFKGNFKDMDAFIAKAGVESVDKIILDLGLSSPHLDSSGRGFSFRNDEPLLMTMDREVGEGAFTARDVVNGWAEEDIANVIYAYGDERYARRIARAIVAEREARKARGESPIETTHQLVAIIEGAVPGIYKRGKIHPATRTFQALRIAVNDELSSLRIGLNKAFLALRPGGRIAVISFHSLEDRIVKRAFKEWTAEGKGDQATKKPIVPSESETAKNPRSRSAKLRIFIKQ